MATAPSFGAAGTYLTGGVRTTSSVAVPAGVVAGSIVTVHMYQESTVALTPPAGFSEVTTAASTTGTVTMHRVFAKRATGADAGTYAFTHTSTYTEGVAARWVGGKTAGSIVDVSNNAVRSTAATGTPAVTASTTALNTRLVWSATSVAQGAWTPPSGWTEHVDPSLEVTVASLAQAATGSTGSIAGVGPSGVMCAWLLALLPAEQGDATSTTTIAATATARVVGTATSATTIAGTAAGAPGPLAAYGFDGSGSTVADDSGNGHSWTLGGGAIRTASGHANGGLTTNGSASTGTVANPAFGQSTNRTVMLWMRNPANTTQWVIRWNVNSLGSGSWGILLLGTEVSVQARNSSTFERATCTRPTDGLWHHYAATWDNATHTLSFYLDGVLTQTNALLTAPLRSDADTIDIGEWTDTSTVIDDLRIYDAALTAAQITALSALAVTAPAALTAGGTSATTIAATATARAVGAASSATSIAATATARAVGVGGTVTTIAATATARLLVLIEGAPRAGAVTMAPSRRATAAAVASGWTAAP